MKTLSAHYIFMIKLRQMKCIQVILELRDRCFESNCLLKTVQMVQIVLLGVSRASASTNNCQKLQKYNIKNDENLFSQYGF